MFIRELEIKWACYYSFTALSPATATSVAVVHSTRAQFFQHQDARFPRSKKHLERGEMFVLDDNGVKAECVITKESDGVYELKNIAVMPDCQRKGYGKRLIEFLFSYYPDCKAMLVGTGDSPAILNFYRRCGFTESHRIINFFTDNYDHPMFENGKQLVDMIYLKWER